MTQPEMGDFLIPHRTSRMIRTYERDTIPYKDLDRWALATGVTERWLLTGEEPTEVDPDVWSAISGLAAEFRQSLDEGRTASGKALEAHEERLAGVEDQLARLLERLPPLGEEATPDA